MNASLEVARRFGANLRRARRRTGLSQEEVGFRASLHRTEIGLLERGARVPRIDTLVKVSAAVGVRVDCALLEGIAWNVGGTTTRPGAFTVPGRVETGEGEVPPESEGERAELVSSIQRPKADPD